MDTDIAIVGAGAAGLSAATFAAESARNSGKPLRVIVLDGARNIGAKILVSGGGRCNVTHDHVTPADFNGSRNIIRNVLAAFDESATVRWFESLGVKLKREETGKLFPVTDSARTILDALLARIRDLDVLILNDHRVHSIAHHEGAFTIQHSHGQLSSRRLVLCTGGRSLPRSGSDGFGLELARHLGHTIAPTFPALVPLVMDPSFFHASLTGLSHPAELTTTVSGKPIDRRAGSLLWTHFGISGPIAMDASRHWIIARSADPATQLLCNFLPGETFESVDRILTALSSTGRNQSILRILCAHLPERLASALCTHIHIDPAMPISQLPRELRRDLVRALGSLPLPVLHDRGWNYAEVTAGGVPLSEISYKTMESRRTPGLYLCGEILDCDGRIGGFNFQWAWSTGFIAGRAAAIACTSFGPQCGR